MNQEIILVSGPVIVKDDKILVDISSDDDFWKFCGGRVKDNENLQDTAIRRAKEELGIKIDITTTIPFLLYTSKETNLGKVDIILAHYLANYTGEIIPGKNVKDWKWIPLKDLETEDLAPNIIPALRHFNFIK